MMKKMNTKLLKIFAENVWLSVAAMIVLMAVVGLGWKWSLYAAGLNRADDSVKALLRTDMENTDATSKEKIVDITDWYENLTIEIYHNQAYLFDAEGKSVFGSCQYIYDDLGCFNYSQVFRYVDGNGLIGYGKVEDHEITILYPGVFSQASRMSDGSACVKEGEEYYYIDTEGKRFTDGKYLMAHPFVESQGVFARVQKPDGSWSVINRKEEEVLAGFDSINELPYSSLTGSGVKDGKAVLFTLEYYQDVQPSITYEFEEYTEILSPYPDSDIAFVTSKSGKKGVVCIRDGEVVVPAEYEDIQWGYVESEDYDGNEQIWFRCQKEDGTYDVRYL